MMPSKMRGPFEPMTGRGGIENGAASEGDGVVDLEARVHVVHEAGSRRAHITGFSTRTKLGEKTIRVLCSKY